VEVQTEFDAVAEGGADFSDSGNRRVDGPAAVD